MTELSFGDLKGEIDAAHPGEAPDDQKFTYWFFLAYLTDNSNLAKSAVCGGPNDRGIDGILIDDKSKTVYLVQSKYRKSINEKTEPDSEITRFTNTINKIFSSNSSVSGEFFRGMEPVTEKLARKARRKVKTGNYSSKFIYVTTGKRPFIYADFAKKRIQADSKRLGIDATFLFFGGGDVMGLLRDYISDAAPPIPTINLRLENNQQISSSSFYKRIDKENEIRTWTITMSGDSISDLFHHHGVKLFARNIRGYLGMSTKGINKKIETTVKSEPEKFYYYNNGITMICDEAKEKSGFLTVGNPQIINGQQTTRVLASIDKSRTSEVGVMVKVVQIPRRSESTTEDFDHIVSKIVDGTNRQNAISQSDLISNHRTQIDLHRRLKPLGFIYLRKKMSKSEAKRIWGAFGRVFISKDEFARASAATQLDQRIVRSGVNHLYENHLYEKVFPNSDPLFYLPRYFVMKTVTSSSRGKPEWSYAKWMITSFIWKHIRYTLNSTSRKNVFIDEIRKKNSKLHQSLEKLCLIGMRSAADFYRKNSGKGVARLDVSQFYRNRSGRNDEFDKYWNSRLNKRRPAFNKELGKFCDTLSQL